MPDVIGDTHSKKLNFCQSTEYFPKGLWDHQAAFWKNWDEPLCSFCLAMVFVLELWKGQALFHTTVCVQSEKDGYNFV